MPLLDTTSTLVATAAAVVAAGIWAFRFIYWIPRHHPIHKLQGPVDGGFLLGAMGEAVYKNPGEAHIRWAKEYGKTCKYSSVFGSTRVFTVDLLATKHILDHSDLFQKEPASNGIVRQVFGPGLLVVEGDQHIKQRKACNPAFSLALLRDDYLPIFWRKALELKEVLSSMLSKEAEHKKKDLAATRLDVAAKMSGTTMDIIGLAGFGTEFQTLSDQGSELAVAIERMFEAGQKIDFSIILATFHRVFLSLPTERHQIQKDCRKTIWRVGKTLVEQKTEEILQEGNEDISNTLKSNTDLLSLIIRSNMNPELKNDQRLDEDEMLSQIATFIAAGAETSGLTMSWGLWRLAQHSRFQTKLREECAACGDNLSYDDLNALDYLDAVVKEVIRFDPGVPHVHKYATEDAVIPLETSIIDQDGTTLNSVICPKGTVITLGITACNKDMDVWGEDAEEFNPERWLNEAGERIEPWHTSTPGIFANQLTFLSGPRHCIGYKFAVLELKVLFFTLVKNFEFGEVDPKPDIWGRVQLVARPTIRGETGLRMPLMVRPVS